MYDATLGIAEPAAVAPAGWNKGPATCVDTQRVGPRRLRRAVLGLTGLLACRQHVEPASGPPPVPPPCGGFDWPVGPPNASGYYDAQPFGGLEAHLGEDWNGNGGGDSDLGDPVFAIADGEVSSARHEGEGWGNVVRVVHRCGDGGEYESLYAHLDVIAVELGAAIGRGTPLGAIGTADGRYLAHLHLELRTRVGAPLGRGYGTSSDHVAPSTFIAANRP